VHVPPSHPRNHDGNAFTVLVTHTVNRPRPGSDEINRAYEEGWIARRGGGRALAFLGNVVATNGREHAEIFIADLPADLTHAGMLPLAGSTTRRPAPPAGVTQRRITFTSDRKFPGVATQPRHWLRASPDGARIAFLMRDDAGVPQLWTIAPEGGRPRQVTRTASGVGSAITWSPDGRWIAHVMDGSVCATEVATGRVHRLTEKREDALAPQPFACVFAPDGRRLAFTRRAPNGFAQVFTVTFPFSP
jgi:hypothetical protein